MSHPYNKRPETPNEQAERKYLEQCLLTHTTPATTIEGVNRNSQNEIMVWTDGSATKQTAAYAVVFSPTSPQNCSGRVHGETTNNNAEIQAAIWALHPIPLTEKVAIYTDSKVLCDIMDAIKAGHTMHLKKQHLVAELIDNTQRQQAAGGSIRMLHTYSHLLDKNKWNRRAKKDKWQQRYHAMEKVHGDLTSLILQMNQIADQHAQKALNDPRPPRLVACRHRPAYTLVDNKGNPIGEQANKFIQTQLRKKHRAVYQKKIPTTRQSKTTWHPTNWNTV